MNDIGLQSKAESPKESRAVVVNTTDDPLKLMRVQVRVPGMWDGVQDDDLPWAEYLLRSARAGGGSFEPAEVGDWVWVDFPNSDTRFPRITGWCHYAPGGVPNLPPNAFAGSNSIQHKLNQEAGEPLPDAAKYHGSSVIEKFGVVFEVNPSGEFLVTQRATGSAVRITRDGSITVHSEKNLYLTSTNSVSLHVGKDFSLKVGGNWEIDVSGTISEAAASHTMRRK